MKHHTIKTKDESVWLDFSGEIPRVGDVVFFEDVRYKVETVEWFFYEEEGISHADVIIKEAYD